MPKFKKVVLSGGAAKAIVHLGVLKYYLENGMLDPIHVNTYAGTSAGSMICLLLACGLSVMDIFRMLYSINNLFSENNDNSAYKTLIGMGLLSIKPVEMILRKTVKSILGSVPTFKELLDKTGKHLIITGGDVSNVQGLYYSPWTTPDKDVIDAVCASSSVPFIFQKRFDGEVCVMDGCLVDNLPVEYVDDGISNILAILVSSKPNSDISSPMGYAHRCTMMPVISATCLRAGYVSDNTTVIRVDCSSPNKEGIPITINLCQEEKMALFSKGYNTAKELDGYSSLELKGWSRWATMGVKEVSPTAHWGDWGDWGEWSDSS